MNRIKNLNEDEIKELKEKYDELLKKIDLSKYKKSRSICRILKINSREWRKKVEDIMHLFTFGYYDKLIISNNKGYILTDDKELIEKYLIAKENQFKSLAYNHYHLKKAIIKKYNFNINDFI